MLEILIVSDNVENTDNTFNDWIELQLSKPLKMINPKPNQIAKANHLMRQYQRPY